MDTIRTLADLSPPPEPPRTPLRLRTRLLLAVLLLLLLAASVQLWWRYAPDERVYATRAYNYNSRSIAEFRVNGMSGGGGGGPPRDGRLAGGGNSIVVGRVIDVSRPLLVEWQMDYETMEDAFAKAVVPTYRAILPPLRDSPGIPDGAYMLVLHFYPDHVEAEFDYDKPSPNGRGVTAFYSEPHPPRNNGANSEAIAPFLR